MDFETARTITIDNVAYHTLTSNPSKDPAHPAPCVLLIHALMSNLHMWDSTVRTLYKAGYSTIRYDHIGHSRTPAPLLPNHGSHDFHRSFKPADWPEYSIDTLTTHAHSLSQTLLSHLTHDNQQAPNRKLHAVIGCSIGGLLALRFPILFPTSTPSHIISICAPDLLKAPKTSLPLWRRRVARFHQDLYDGTERLCQETVERWFPSPVPDSEDAEPDPRTENARIKALGQVRGCKLEGYMLLAAAICRYDFGESGLADVNHEGGEEGKVGVKVLVVAGGLDTASDAGNLERQAAGIRGAEFVCLGEAGHLPPMQSPGEFEGVVVGFLGDARGERVWGERV